MAVIGLTTKGILAPAAVATDEQLEAQLSGEIAAGKPDQFIIIRDPLVEGTVVSVDSEQGPRIGLTVPDAGNIGSLAPLISGEPDTTTEAVLTVRLNSGGGLETAEWVYKSNDDAVGWVGAHHELHSWGWHTATPQNHTGAIAIYSSVFRRIVVLSYDTAAENVSSRWLGLNERPDYKNDWEDNVSSFTPRNGVRTADHSLAGCELRDGTLLLVVRQKQQNSSPTNISQEGDFDIYKSVDGGVNWRLTVESIIQRFHRVNISMDSDFVPRVAASGDWVRLVLQTDTGSQYTLISSDGGSTWLVGGQLGTPIGMEVLTDQSQDVCPMALVSVDDQSGGFLMFGNPRTTGAGNRVGIWYATRDSDWEELSISDLAVGTAPSLPATPRAYLAYRDPAFFWLWVYVADPGSAEDGWHIFRARRESFLEDDSWEYYEEPITLRGATRLAPTQSQALWVEDRAMVLSYLQDIEVSSPYSRKSDEAFVYWIGGFSRRPSSVDYERNNGLTGSGGIERLHWNASMGEPKAGATSSTQSAWLSTIAAGGTHSWSARFYAEANTDAFGDQAYWGAQIPLGVDQLPQWDPLSGADLREYQKTKRFVLEWVANVGLTNSINGSFGIRIKQPSLGGGGWGWELALRMAGDRVGVYNVNTTAWLGTMSGLILDTADTDRFHRFRFCVTPATSPANPQAVLMYRRESGDDWQTSAAFSLGAPTSSAGLTMQEIEFGNILHLGGLGVNGVSHWRELRVFADRYAADYAEGISLPSGLPGARVSSRPRGFTAGAGVSSDPGRLRIAWGGSGAHQLDQWVHRIEHDYPSEALTIDSPQVKWRSAAGATAGCAIVYDAADGASLDTGERFAHTGAAIFGLENHRAQLVYSDDEAGLVNATTVNLNGTQYEDIRISAVSGRVLTVGATNSLNFRHGELAGRFLRFTAGTSCVGHVHKVDKHIFDGTNHMLVLSTGSQFATSLISVGATASIFADRAWTAYGQTIVRRYMRLKFGGTGDNNWAGHWTAGQFVPGMLFEFNPPINWSHTDEEVPNVVVQRSRNGQSWAYEEGPAGRTFVGRQVGDVDGARMVLRDLLRTIAGYALQPIALLLNDENTADEDRSLWLTRWVGGSTLDQQAWARRAAREGAIARPVGDEQIQLEEIV